MPRPNLSKNAILQAITEAQGTYPTITDLKEKTGYSLVTLRNTLAQLAFEDLITIENNKRPYTYTLR